MEQSVFNEAIDWCELYFYTLGLSIMASSESPLLGRKYSTRFADLLILAVVVIEYASSIVGCLASLQIQISPRSRAILYGLIRSVAVIVDLSKTE